MDTISQRIYVWLISLRPFSFTASIIPLWLGVSYSRSFKQDAHVFSVALIVVIGLLLHAIANLFNSYYDWVSGLDTARDKKLVPVLIRPGYGPRAVVRSATVLSALALVFAAILAWIENWVALPLTLCGLATAYFYCGPPVAYKHHGLAQVGVFVSMGILLTIAPYLILVGHWSWLLFVFSLPVASLTTAIIQGNELRDWQHDQSSGCYTLTVRIGPEAAVLLYSTLLTMPYIVTLALLFAGIFPSLSLVTLLSIPLYLRLMRLAATANYQSLDVHTAKLHLVFGLLYVLAIVRFVPGTS